MKAKYGVFCLLILIVVSGSCYVSFSQPNGIAPDVSFMSITGKKIALNSLRGKPVLVTFWATDCPSCIKEIPHLLDLHHDFHHQGLEIIAVSMYYDPPSHVVAMAAAKRLPYFVALDIKAELAHAFGDVQLTPSTFLIAPNGSITLQKTGAFDFVDMKSHIELLLKG
jgi:peroxiredoxin